MRRAARAMVAAIAVGVMACGSMAAEPAAAVERGPETNLPIPRYVSLKTSEGYARRGPSTAHKIDWVFVRKDMPLQIIGEYGHWRQVRDRDGATGWVHYSLLSGVRTVIVEKDLVPMHMSPEDGSPAAANAEAGVVGPAGRMFGRLVPDLGRRLSRLGAQDRALGGRSGRDEELMADPRSGVPRTAVIHADASWLKAIREGRYDFLVKLEAKLKQEGMAVHLADADSRAARLLMAEDTLNIMIGTPPAYGPRILHAMPAYVWGFWYLDEVGVNWNSSIRFARFHPSEVDADKADYFFNGVAGHMLRENVSKLPQEARMHQPLQPAAAVVFCQEIEAQRCHYLTTEQMIRTVAGHERPGPIYVKLHPNQSKATRRTILAVCNDFPRIRISEASIHDLIQAADLVVTQNSAAGFEALMHRKPVVTCAKSDFWHATLTAKTVSDLREAMNFGPEAMADFPYEKYLYWFLDRQCLEPQKDIFAARVWARIREKVLF